MCCRYYYADDYRDLLDDIIKSERIMTSEPIKGSPGQDVCPSNESTVISGNKDGLSADNMYWGFTNPYRKGLIINARAETAREKKLFSDNDMLSALVAVFCGACKLVIFSDIDGLYDGNPKENPDAKLISRVEDITDDLKSIASGSGSNRGTGGMITKLEAAEYATDHGIDVLVTNGKNPEKLYDVIDKKKVGTLFVAK